MKETRLEKIFAICFSAVTAVLLGAALICAGLAFQTRKEADLITGVITDIYGEGTEVSYVYHGREYEVCLSETSSSMRPGEKIELYVQRDNPQKVRTKALLFLPVWILSMIGVCFFIVALVFIILAGMKGKKKKYLLEEGRVIEAVVIGGHMNYNVSVNGRHPWKLECQYEDISQNATYLYSSYNIWQDPQFYVGQTVRVYIDRQNPKKYYVDVENLLTTQTDKRIMDYR